MAETNRHFSPRATLAAIGLKIRATNLLGVSLPLKKFITLRAANRLSDRKFSGLRHHYCCGHITCRHATRYVTSHNPQPSFTYQLRIVLRDVSPLIWRRLLVPNNIDLARLSRILQILFSWSGEHLHCFHIHGQDYGTAYAGAVSSGNDPRQVRLSDFHLHHRERFLYQYDFTSGWELEIRIEDILPFDQARSYPICIGGKRAGPPGHCLGALAYLEWRDQYFFRYPLEDLSLVAEALRRFLESGDRPSIGGLNDLREAAERIKAYRLRRPDHFDRRTVNGQLRALSEQEGGRR